MFGGLVRLSLKMFFAYGRYRRQLIKTVKSFRKQLKKEGLPPSAIDQLTKDFEAHISIEPHLGLPGFVRKFF